MNPTEPLMSRQKPTMLCIAPILLSMVLATSATVPALAADTIVIVTTVGDLGGSCPGANCTLRAAIEYANASPDLDQIIGFNISGACPRTIEVFSDLPTIGDSLSIRGYTQLGAAPNTLQTGDDATLCIQLQPASGSSSVVNGLRFAPADIADTLDVSGLAIGGFDTGILVTEGHFTLHGNFIGLSADGSTQHVNHYNGIEAQNNSLRTGERLIGGPDAGDRNVISGNGTGVSIVGGQTNITVRNNYIGTDRSGTVALANSLGVYIYGLSNGIDQNVISGNLDEGVRLDSDVGSANSISRNHIGLKAFATCVPSPCVPTYALGNGGNGVAALNGAAGNSIATNEIAWNGGDGISLPSAGQQNSIVANSMHDNAGLGIDLGSDGVTANDNDATAPAGAPNRLLNFPVLSDAGGNDAGGNVSGFLESTNGTYTIDVYADTLPDPSLHGEGRDYLGSGEITISNAPAGNNGLASFTLPISSTDSLAAKHISATAMDANSNTSEFSAGVVYALDDLIFANGFELSPP